MALSFNSILFLSHRNALTVGTVSVVSGYTLPEIKPIK
jgi:hypothetical protein